MPTPPPLTALAVEHLAAYLAATGWGLSPVGSWTHDSGQSVRLAGRDDRPGACDTVIEALEVVSMVEDRSPEIVADAIAAGHRGYHGKLIATWSRQQHLRADWSPAVAPDEVRYLAETTVARLDPHRVEEYLTERGWRATHTWPDGRQMWLHDTSAVEAILIPPGRRYDEDNAALADVLYRIAFAEDRSVREVLREAAGFHPHAVLVAAEPDPTEPVAAVAAPVAVIAA